MVLAGKPVAEKIYESLDEASKKCNIRCSIAVVLVGEDPASLTYVKAKEKIVERLGFDFKLLHLSGVASEKQVEKLIVELNQNKYVSGIIVQLPLPADFNTPKILAKIAQKKDIDGFQGHFPPPAAQAILEILKFYKISLKGKKIVIVGHGRLVGAPLEKLLLKQGIKPEICDLKTPDLKKKILSGDIIISAAGAPGLIRPEMVNSRTIIIDAGTAEAGGKLMGDVAPETYQKVAGYTPVPGGVGPVTVAMLMKNVVRAAREQE